MTRKLTIGALVLAIVATVGIVLVNAQRGQEVQRPPDTHVVVTAPQTAPARLTGHTTRHAGRPQSKPKVCPVQMSATNPRWLYCSQHVRCPAGQTVGVGAHGGYECGAMPCPPGQSTFGTDHCSSMPPTSTTTPAPPATEPPPIHRNLIVNDACQSGQSINGKCSPPFAGTDPYSHLPACPSGRFTRSANDGSCACPPGGQVEGVTPIGSLQDSTGAVYECAKVN